MYTTRHFVAIRSTPLVTLCFSLPPANSILYPPVRLASWLVTMLNWLLGWLLGHLCWLLNIHLRVISSRQ